MFISPKKIPFWAFITVLIGLLSATPDKAWGLDGGYDKGFYFQSDDKNYLFKFNLQIMAMHEYVAKEAALDQNSFSLPRVRSFFKGNAFSPKIKYLLSVDYSTTHTKEKTGPDIRDGHLTFEIAKFFKIRAGRFYIPINREDYYNSTGMNLVDTSLLNAHFEVLRDYGLQFSGAIVEPLQYWAFLTNGDGKNPANNNANKNKEFQVGSRLEWAILGKLDPRMGDYEFSKKPNLAVGGTILYDFGAADETQDFQSFVEQQIDPQEEKLVRGDLDAAVAWLGTSIFGQWQFAYNPRFRTFDHGYMGQLGVFIIPKRLEIAGRYAAVIPDFPFAALAQTGLTKGNEGSGVPLYEWVGGVSYYIKGHDLKVQADYSQRLNVGGVRNLNDQVVRTKLTFAF